MGTIQYDTTKYKAWKLPHPLLLHWVINPGLAVNELLLGQRIPKLTLIDKTSDAPLMERQYVPCPHCAALNDGRLWSKSNGLGHWFGYVCPMCGGVIPCLWNITSLIVLAITFPIWIWIVIFYKEKWLKRERERFAKVELSGLPQANKTTWRNMGISFGMLMFTFNVSREALSSHFSLSVVLISLLLSILAGWLFAKVMKLFLNQKE